MIRASPFFLLGDLKGKGGLTPKGNGINFYAVPFGGRPSAAFLSRNRRKVGPTITLMVSVRQNVRRAGGFRRIESGNTDT